MLAIYDYNGTVLEWGSGGSTMMFSQFASTWTSIENDKKVKVQLHGACVSCTVNQMTLKTGVEMTIKKHVPQIEEVVSVQPA